MLARPLAPRDLSSRLETAGNQQVTRVVAMVDALAQRGAADALIAPLRPRLAQLRPQRPLRLSRLLFVPLDPVIVPPPRWRPGSACIPRSILAVAAAAVLGRLDDVVAKLDAGLARHDDTDGAAALGFGASLWPAAAAAFRDMALPPGWAEQTGLPAEHWPQLRDAMSAILALALPIEAAVRDPSQAKPLMQVLSAACGAAPAHLVLALTIMLARHPRPDTLLAAVAATRRPILTAAMDQTLTAALDDAGRAMERMAAFDLSSAAAQAAQLAGVLDAADTPARRARVREVRAAAQGACAARLERGLQEDVLGKLAVLAADDDAGMMAAEAAARDAKRFEVAARRLGPGSTLGHALRQAAAGLTGPGVGPVDRIRLTEILLGSEEAAGLA